MNRPFLCALGAAVALMAAAAPAASAHGGASGYVSTVEDLRPPTPDIEVEVLDGDDRLALRNTGPETVIVLGYDGEPYLRFTAQGVDRNANSPATYLNQARYGEADVPEALEDADPRWQRVAAAGAAYDWHDHRIHWMSRTPPPPVRDDPDSAHTLFEWKVPLLVAGKPVTVEGVLAYEPPGSSLGRLLLYGGLPALALLVVLVLFLRARPVRRR